MSDSDWAPVQRLRAHEQVMTQIEERILDGRLAAGDHLPSERDLAAALGVSRPSLRESLRVLEALGLLEVRRGGGPEGGARLVTEPGSGLVDLLRLQLALGHFDQRDVLRTRLALETWSCSEAALHASAEDHAELAAILDEMDRPGIGTGDFNRLDAAFHVRIAASSGNVLTGHLMTSLRGAINRQMIDAYAALEDWQRTAETVRSEHRAILAAIVAGDADAASRAVREHIESFWALGRIAD